MADHVENYNDLHQLLVKDIPTVQGQDDNWETNHLFISQLVPLMGLERKDVFIDAGCGTGLVSIRIAFENVVSVCVAIEIDARRYESAKETIKRYEELMREQERSSSEIGCVKHNFLSRRGTVVMKDATIVFAAVNPTQEYTNFFLDQLNQKQPGYRIITNLELVNFKDSIHDENVQVVKVDTSIEGNTKANTSGNPNFVPFYMYTLRNASFTDANYELDELAVADQVVFPLQLGKRWNTFQGKVVEVQEFCALVSATPSVESTLLLYAWIPNSEIFKTVESCKGIVKARNIANFTPAPEPIIPDDQKIDLDFVINDLLTPPIAKALCIDKRWTTYLKHPGCRYKGFAFHCQGVQRAKDYFENSNPDLKIPCKLERFTAFTDKTLLPDDDQLTSLGPYYGDQTRKMYPVAVTNPQNFRVAEESKPIDYILKYMAKDPTKKKLPKAMYHIPIAYKDRFVIQPPKVLRLYDSKKNNQYGYPDVRDNVTTFPLDKSVSIIGKGSVTRMRCNQDGSIVWVTVAKGIKLYLFVLKPTVQDYEFLKVCSNPKFQKQFISEGMKERLVCVVLRPGETLIYPGHLPHATYGCTNVLSYGGRYVIPQNFSRVLSFPQENLGCTGFGYDYAEYVKMVYQGLGGIHYNLWRMLTLHTAKFNEIGTGIIQSIEDLFRNNRVNLKISKEKKTYCKIFFASLLMRHGTGLIQSVFGVHYTLQCYLPVGEALKRVLKYRHFIPAITNVVSTQGFRAMELPSRDDLDYSEEEGIPKYTFTELYPALLRSAPLTFLGIQDSEFSMYATNEIPEDTLLAEFTGYLRTNEQAEDFYDRPHPVGKMYFLTEHTKNGKTSNVFVDANKIGGFSLFVKCSDTPNLTLKRVRADNRIHLLVYSKFDLVENEQLFLPWPAFSDFNHVCLLPIDAAIGDLEDFCYLDIGVNKEHRTQESSTEQTELESTGHESPQPSTSAAPLQRDPFVKALSPELCKRYGISKQVKITLEQVKAGVENAKKSIPRPVIPDTQPVDPDQRKTAKTRLYDDGAAKQSDAPKDFVPQTVGEQSQAQQMDEPDTLDDDEPDNLDDDSKSQSVGEESQPKPKENFKKPEGKAKAKTDHRRVHPEPSPRRTRSKTEQERTQKSSDPMPGPSRAPPKGPKRRPETTAPPDSTDSDSEDGIAQPDTFELLGRTLRTYHALKIPSMYAEKYYDKLTPEQKRAILEISVALFYKEYETYIHMRNKLMHMYRCKRYFGACFVCFHLGLPIYHYGHERLHIFTEEKAYEHFLNYHNKPFKCSVCHQDFDSKLKLARHANAMAVRPNRAHKAHQQHKKPKKVDKSPQQQSPQEEEDLVEINLSSSSDENQKVPPPTRGKEHKSK